MKKITNTLKAVSSYIKSHKLVSFLAIILLLIVGNFAYNKYLDWDNAQMIKGLSNDFPVLVQKVEAATGIDLEIKSTCMQTQEKFSSGVSICSYTASESEVTEEQLEKQNEIFESQSVFKKFENFPNGEGFTYKYRNKYACAFSYAVNIYIDCQTGVRDANKNKLSELLN